jgi:hypothetical protein
VFQLPESLPQLGNINLGCFLHLAFSNDRRDVYTSSGIHVAARRAQSVIRSFDKPGCYGFMSYNESFADHFNAFLASRLGWNPEEDVRSITAFYCAMILGVRGEAVQELVDVILDMEMLEGEKAAGWSETLRRLEPEVHPHPLQPWVYAHILGKAEIMALDYTIKQKLEVSAESALSDMEARLAISDKLWRQAYGFGVMRRIFPFRLLPEWHSHYAKLIGGQITTPSFQSLYKQA